MTARIGWGDDVMTFGWDGTDDLASTRYTAGWDAVMVDGERWVSISSDADH